MTLRNVGWSNCQGASSLVISEQKLAAKDRILEIFLENSSPWDRLCKAFPYWWDARHSIWKGSFGHRLLLLHVTLIMYPWPRSLLISRQILLTRRWRQCLFRASHLAISISIPGSHHMTFLENKNPSLRYFLGVGYICCREVQHRDPPPIPAPPLWVLILFWEQLPSLSWNLTHWMKNILSPFMFSLAPEPHQWGLLRTTVLGADHHCLICVPLASPLHHSLN